MLAFYPTPTNQAISIWFFITGSYILQFMALEEFKNNRKTITTAVSLPQNVLHKLDSFVETGEYGSRSSIVVQALTDFFASEGRGISSFNYEGVQKMVVEFLSSTEGKTFIQSVIRESLSNHEGNAFIRSVIRDSLIDPGDS